MSTMLRIDYTDGHEVFVDMKVHLVRYKVEWPQYLTTTRHKLSRHFPFVRKVEKSYLTKGYIVYHFSNGDRRTVTYSKREDLIKAMNRIEAALQSGQDEVIHAYETNVSDRGSNTAYP